MACYILHAALEQSRNVLEEFIFIGRNEIPDSNDQEKAEIQIW